MIYSFVLLVMGRRFGEPGDTVIPLSAVAMSAVYVAALYYVKRQEERASILNRVVSELQKNFRVHQMSPAEVEAFDDDPIFIGTAFTIALEIGIVLLFVLAFGVLGFVLAGYRYALNFSAKMEMRFKHQWRSVHFKRFGVFASVYRALFLFLLMALVLSGFYLALLIGNGHEREGSLSQVVPSALSEFAADYFTKLSGLDVYKVVMETQQEMHRADNDLADRFSGYLILFLLGFLVLVFVHLRSHIREYHSALSEKLLGVDKAARVPDSPIRSWKDRAMLGIFLAVMAVSQFGCVLLALDITLSFFGYQPFFFKFLVVYTEIVGVLLVEQWPGYFAVLVIGVLKLLLVLPGYWLLFLASYRIGNALVIEANGFKNSGDHACLGHVVESALRKACEEQGLALPLVLIDEKEPYAAYSESSLSGRKKRIVLGGVLVKHNNQQIPAALIAHEAAHLRKDAAFIARAKFLSALLLFPANFLTLFYDYAEGERRADKLAVKIVDESALVAAIHSLSRATPPSSEKTRFGRAVSLFWDDSIMGASYDNLLSRLVRMRESK